MAVIKKLSALALVAFETQEQFMITSSYQNSVGIYFAVDFVDNINEPVVINCIEFPQGCATLQNQMYMYVHLLLKCWKVVLKVSEKECW